MQVTIRQENPQDYAAVLQLIAEAFEPMELSDHQEQFLVDRLRKSSAFVPNLSMVAESNHKIVGHITIDEAKIKQGENEFDSLAHAPVLPDYSRQGNREMLIKQVHRKAREMGTNLSSCAVKTTTPRFRY